MHSDLNARPAAPDAGTPSGTVDLYWIPLGAGAHIVKISGAVFEAIAALLGHRSRCDLYHSALVIDVPEGRFVVEQAPVPNLDRDQRGVVAEGPVGTRWAGRFRIFRYEIRRWRGGTIPDAASAIASPVRVSADLAVARQILDVLPSIPTPVWGRDELGTGEMWNSNSVISWSLACGGVEVETIRCPAGGRAPGWNAGLAVSGDPPRTQATARGGAARGEVTANGSGWSSQGIAVASIRSVTRRAGTAGTRRSRVQRRS